MGIEQHDPDLDTFSGQLRLAITTCGRSRYKISEQTGISQATLCRFMQGIGGFSLPNLDRLIDMLDLELRPRRNRKDG
jgi:hypothetical protein